jgi:hypothetical protein
MVQETRNILVLQDICSLLDMPTSLYSCDANRLAQMCTAAMPLDSGPHQASVLRVYCGGTQQQYVVFRTIIILRFASMLCAGALSEEEAAGPLDAAVGSLLKELQALPVATGTLTARLAIDGSTGCVEELTWLTDTLIPLQGDAATVRAEILSVVRNHLTAAEFPPSQEGEVPVLCAECTLGSTQDVKNLFGPSPLLLYVCVRLVWIF